MKGESKMKKLYVVKEFGRTHFFRTHEERAQFIESLPDYVQKFVLTIDQTLGVKK